MSDSTNRPQTSYNQMGELEKRKHSQFKSERRHGLKMIDKKWNAKKITVATKMLKQS